MEVVHVFHSTSVNGPEALVIPALARLGQSVGVIFLKEDRAGSAADAPIQYAQSFGIPVFSVPVRSRYDLKAMKALGRLFESIGARIVHAHDVKASTYSLKACRLQRYMPFLVSTHHGVRARIGLRNKLYEHVYVKNVLPYYDLVLAVCSSDRRLLIRRGLSSEKVRVHLNGVDRPLVSPEARVKRQHEIQAAWGLSSSRNEVILGMVGRLEPEKRVDKILQVLASLKKRHPNLPAWRFICFGEGSLRDELKQTSESLELSNLVEWKGYRDRVGNEMAGFDVLLSLSDAEGLPINLLEAGWAGTAIFATAIDGVLDLVPAESFGRLVSTSLSIEQAADFLAELVSDGHLRRELGLAFQRRVTEDFSAGSWLKQLQHHYGEALPGRKFLLESHPSAVNL